MASLNDKTRQIFKSISYPGTVEDLPKESLDDALNIVVEAVNSSIGGIIITDLDGISFFVEVSASTVTSTSGERIGKMASFIDITQRKMLDSELQHKLEDTLEQIEVLSGVLPICVAYKKIRGSKGCWSQIEVYIKENSEAEFSHGICPDCAKILYPDFSE